MLKKILSVALAIASSTNISKAEDANVILQSEKKVIHIDGQRRVLNYSFATADQKAALIDHNIVTKFKSLKTIELPKTVNLSEYIHHVKNQKDIGACTGFSTTQAMEIRANIEAQQAYVKLNPASAKINIFNAINNNYVELSPQFLYQIERIADGTLYGEDEGSTLTQAVTQICKIGVCSEKKNPFLNTLSAIQTKPTAAMYDDATNHMDLDNVGLLAVKQKPLSFKTALAQSYPIVGGIQLYNSFQSEEVSKKGIVSMPDESSEECIGGHAVTCIGYGYNDEENTMMYQFVNSWGEYWGGESTILGGQKSRGFFWVPEEYITSFSLAGDFHAIKNIGKGNFPKPVYSLTQQRLEA